MNYKLLLFIYGVLSLSNDHYIVLLKSEGDGITRNNMNTLDAHIEKVNQIYQRSLFKSGETNNNSTTSHFKQSIKRRYEFEDFKGYSVNMNPSLLNSIKSMNEVELIERDNIASINFNFNINKQNNAPWGLSRISQRKVINKLYSFDKSGGQGVNAYVIDTGININHDQFEGRAKWGKNFVEDSDDTDENGHGTHVAGTIGSKLYGVSKKSTLIAVKVLNAKGSGAYSDIIAGIQWAANDSKKNKGKSVANMSLGGEFSKSINRAMESAVKSGLAFAVAAGNDDKDACNYSPASSEYVLTIGSMNIKDRKSKFSNWGKCVSLFAPGENILSTWIGNNDSTNSISGTSMASPHVAGLMAYFLGKEDLSVKQLYDKIIQATTPNQISGLSSDTNNLLAYNLIDTLA